MKQEIGYDIGIGAAYKDKTFEEACGTGSRPDNNKKYCGVLLKTLRGLDDIQKIVDYGCGNLQSYKGNINWTKEPYEYVGYDAHKGCIEELRKRYPTLTFKEAVLDEMPETSDVLIIKDVLIHWFDVEIKTFIESALKRHKYVIYMHSTTEQGYPNRKNKRAGFYNDEAVHVAVDKTIVPYEKNCYGYKCVPYNLLPEDKIIHKENIKGDSMKTFILFGDRG